MKNQLLQLPAIISKIETKRNRSLRLQVNTNEDLTDEMMQKIMSNLECYGYFCFLKEKNIKKENVINLPKLPIIEKNEKTPSQRLRAVLFLIWQNTKKEKSFNVFYDEYMNKIIEKLKERI